MTTPTHDEIDALLAPVYEQYGILHIRIARLSLVDVLAVTRRHYPTAAFLKVDETDQDMSGALVASDEDVLDGDGNMLSADDDVDFDHSWSDDLWNPLINLDGSNQAVWHPFLLQDEHGRNWRLDLNAIEAAVDNLMKEDA